MGQYVSVEIEADTILDAMAESGEFAYEMWDEIQTRLDQGGLLDDCMDIVQGWERDKTRAFLGSLRLMVKSIEQHLGIDQDPDHV